MGGVYEAVAVAFSADGATLYVVTSTTVFSIQENGDNSVKNWARETTETDLCDITVNGLSVRKRRTYAYIYIKINVYIYTLLEKKIIAEARTPVTLARAGTIRSSIVSCCLVRDACCLKL